MGEREEIQDGDTGGHGKFTCGRGTLTIIGLWAWHIDYNRLVGVAH